MSDEAQQSPGTPRGGAPYVHQPPRRVEVVYRSFADFVVSMGPTLSKLRLFVETEEEIPLGTTVHTEIRLHERPVLIRAMGEVSGFEDNDGSGPAGIHVELRYLDPAGAALIDAVLRHGRDALSGDEAANAALLAGDDGEVSTDVTPTDDGDDDHATDVEVPESGELNLAGWEDEVGTLVELALVDDTARAGTAEVKPPSEAAAEPDPAEADEAGDSIAEMADADADADADAESEATDALAAIAARVMTDADDPAVTAGTADLEDTHPVAAAEEDPLEDTQPVAEVPDDHPLADDAEAVDEVPSDDTLPAGAALDAGGEASTLPPDQLEVPVDAAEAPTTESDGSDEDHAPASDVPASDVRSVGGDELASSAEEDSDLEHLMFEEPSPSIEMYVSAIDRLGGTPAAASDADSETPDALDETALEPALQPVAPTEPVVPTAAPARQSTPIDLDERLPGSMNVKPLQAVDEGETSFAFGDDTAALIGGLDAWPGDGDSAVTPPDEVAPSPALGEHGFETVDRIEAADGAGTSAATPTASQAPTAKDTDDPLSQPPSEDTVKVKLGKATSFLDPDDLPPEVAASGLVEPATTTEPAAPAIASPAASTAPVEPLPPLTETMLPANVAQDMARDRLNEHTRGTFAGGAQAKGPKGTSWLRPVLLLVLLAAVLGWGLAQRLPFLKPLWQRFTPTTAEQPSDTREGTVAASTDGTSPGGTQASAGPSTAEPTNTPPGEPADLAVTDPAITDPAITDPAATVPTTGVPPQTGTPATATATDATTTPSSDPATIEAAVREAVGAWQRAWSQQNPEAYLAIYSPEFAPDNGASRPAWADSRRIRLRAPERIRIGVDNLEVRVNGPDQAEAWFFQTFETDQTVRVTWKQLDFVREGTRWRIRRERVRQGPPS